MLPPGSRWRISLASGEAGTVRSSAGPEGTQAGPEAGHHPGTASAHRGRRRSGKRPGRNLKRVYNWEIE